MGNANGREETANNPSNDDNHAPNSHAPERVASSDSMGNTPPQSPRRSRSPLLFAPQVPVAPLQRGNGPLLSNQMWQNESLEAADLPPEQGIPTLITWNYGGNDVAVEGSWDNWISRKKLQKSGKDHTILLVLPSGIYHCKFIVDGEQRYIPDLPFVADEMGHFSNLLDVHDYVPENLESVAEFEAPPSPNSSYSQVFPGDEEFAKEPVAVPPQLHLTVLGAENTEDASSSKPRHVVLNHLFIEKGWASQSVVALGLTHRFQSKYVTLVLYKPLKRRPNLELTTELHTRATQLGKYCVFFPLGCGFFWYMVFFFFWVKRLVYGKVLFTTCKAFQRDALSMGVSKPLGMDFWKKKFIYRSKIYLVRFGNGLLNKKCISRMSI